MTELEVMKIIVNEAFHVHKSIGPGMLENVYKNCLAYRLRENGLLVEVEKPVPVFFEEIRMECGYRVDIFVGNVVVEVKSIVGIGDIEIAQVLTYLRFLECRFGLILNFNSVLLKNGIRRVVRGF